MVIYFLPFTLVQNYLARFIYLKYLFVALQIDKTTPSKYYIQQIPKVYTLINSNDFTVSPKSTMFQLHTYEMTNLYKFFIFQRKWIGSQLLLFHRGRTHLVCKPSSMLMPCYQTNCDPIANQLFVAVSLCPEHYLTQTSLNTK